MTIEIEIEIETKTYTKIRNIGNINSDLNVSTQKIFNSKEYFLRAKIEQIKSILRPLVQK